MHRRHDTLRLCALATAALLALGPGGAAAAPPERVVSINLCTDLLAMRVAAPGQLVSVSFLAQDPAHSPVARAARRFPGNKGSAEEVLGFRPELVVAGAYSARESVAMLRRLGYRVEVFPLVDGFDGIRAQLRRMGTVLEQQPRAEAIIAAFDSALRSASPPPTTRARPLAITYGPNGFIEGVGTLGHDILTASGLENLATRLGRPGYTQLPLELLLLAEPDLVILPEPPAFPARAYEITHHPALQRANLRAFRFSENVRGCDGANLTDAVAELAAAARELRQ